MSFRNLDGQGDWVFGLGRHSYVNENQEILLNAKTRVLSFLGDCFFAPQDGIDWWHLLDYNKQAEMENAVMATIAETEGVESVNEMDSIINADRKRTLTYSNTTIYGSTFKQELTPVI